MSSSTQSPVPTALVLTGLAAVATGFLLFLGAPARRAAAPAPLAPQAALILGPLAYRLHIVPPEDPDRAIAFYFEKTRTDSGGLSRALLASAYLAKARSAGAHWYLLAERTARESLEILPFENDGALLVLARVAEARHDFDRAVTLSGQVARADHPEALAVRYSCALARGRLEEALALATTLVERQPSTGTLAQRAAVHLAADRDALADADLRRALALEEAGELESSARARVLLGRLARKRGEPALAAALHREALRIRPAFVPALVALAEQELATGTPQNVLPALLAADAVPALRVLAVRLLARRDPAAADALSRATEQELRRDLAAGGLGHRRDLAALLVEREDPAARAEAAALMHAEAGLRRDATTLDLLARALKAAKP